MRTLDTFSIRKCLHIFHRERINSGKRTSIPLTRHSTSTAATLRKVRSILRRSFMSENAPAALKLVKWASKLRGLDEAINKLCSSSTIEEQRQIWHSKMKHVLFGRGIKWASSNP